MGTYRATMNIPGLRFGQSAEMDDDSPRVINYVISGALFRTDVEAPIPVRPAPVEVPAFKADEPVSNSVDGDIEAIDDEVDADANTSEDETPAKSVAVKSASETRAAEKKAALAEAAKKRAANKPTGGSSSVNPDLGIGFD